jgi:hypothetical protein
MPGVAYPVWGESFLNFGWIGVVLVSFGWGYVTSSLWTRWHSGRSGRTIADPIAVLATILLINVVSRGYFVQTVYTYGSFLFLPMLAWRLGSRQRRSQDDHVSRSPVLRSGPRRENL